jgi:hypothetical protein
MHLSMTGIELSLRLQGKRRPVCRQARHFRNDRRVRHQVLQLQVDFASDDWR